MSPLHEGKVLDRRLHRLSRLLRHLLLLLLLLRCPGPCWGCRVPASWHHIPEQIQLPARRRIAPPPLLAACWLRQLLLRLLLGLRQWLLGLLVLLTRQWLLRPRRLLDGA